MNSDEAFTLSWEEIVDLYETLCNTITEGWEDYGKTTNVFERLQEALQPRDVVEG